LRLSASDTGPRACARSISTGKKVVTRDRSRKHSLLRALGMVLSSAGNLTQPVRLRPGIEPNEQLRLGANANDYFVFRITEGGGHDRQRDTVRTQAAAQSAAGQSM
jgi:hypothetical protein